MRRFACFALAVAISSVPLSAAASGPSDRLIEGDVVSATSRWDRTGKTIVTESVIRRADGTRTTVRQLGGTVDGIGQIAWHAPPVLSPGDYVAVELADDGGWVRGLSDPVLRSEFVRTRNDFDTPLEWRSGCVFITFHPAGTTHIPGESEFVVLEQSIGQWQFSTQDCSYLELRVLGRRDGDVGLDGENLVVFREDVWCRNGEPDECYDASTAGITTMSFINNPDSDRDGELLDADIEFNAVNFAISIDGVSNGSSGCNSDLSNTATHELGHLLGLDHTCFDSTSARMTDHNGDPVPNCFPESSLSEEITEATMYNFQDCDEQKKSTLEDDDVAAVCAIYPNSRDPGSCDRPDIPNGGCCLGSVAGNRRGGAGALAVVALAIMAVLRRRPSRRARRSGSA